MPIIKILHPLKTAHAGTPKTKDKRFVIKEIIKKFFKEQNPVKEFFIAGKFFCDIEDPMCKEIGVSLIWRGYTYNTKAAEGYLLKMADDSNWEVREYAGGAFASLVKEHPEFYEQLMIWVRHPSENVRRAVVISAIGLRNKENIKKAFILLEPLLYDCSRYVKKNLGPFVIGSYFGSAFPEETFVQLKKWSKIKDEHVRWNIAMSFNNSFGNNYPEKAIEIIKSLLKDESKTVKRAVISTLRFLRKRHAGIINKFIVQTGNMM